MEKIIVQSLPRIIVASHREVIKSYDELGPLCVNVIGPEIERLGCKCSPTGYCFSTEYPSAFVDGIDVEYCEQVEEALADSDIIRFRTLPAVKRAVCLQHVGPYTRFNETYTKLFRYIEEQGLRVAGNPRAVYVDGAWNQPDPAKWLSIIQIPVE